MNSISYEVAKGIRDMLTDEGFQLMLVGLAELEGGDLAVSSTMTQREAREFAFALLENLERFPP